MKRSIRWYDYITINIYFLGLTTLSQTNGLVIPLLVQGFVGESTKATYLGTLRLWTLMTALLFQAIWGMLSDRSSLRWGRRRPFIFAGTLLNVALFAVIGLTAGLEGMAGFWILFGVVIFQQIASNIGQAAEQGLIPDLISEEHRGRFSGVKAMLELPLPLILVAFTVGPMLGAGNLWGALGITIAILLATMLLTMLVPEQQAENPPPFNWGPIVRLALMAGVFTAIILVSGGAIRLLGRLLDRLEGYLTLMSVMGVAGLLMMVLAVGLGVWLCVRISLGAEAARRNRSFTWWVINRLAFLVGAINLSIFAVYFVQARLGYEREAAAGPASILMMMVGVFILISALPSGWLADRFGRRPLVALSGVLAAAGTLIALSAPSLTIIYIGGSLIGIATGFFYSANWALGTDVVPKAEAGRYLGISNLAGAGAGAVGAYIGGPIADYFTARFPAQPGSGYVLLFAIFGGLFLLSVLALRGIRQPAAAGLGTVAGQVTSAGD